MATITEDYVSFEIAKPLKEKGFDEKVISFYPPGDIQRPTLQMVMKWLREVHKLSIEPYYDIVLSWVVDIKHIGKYTNHKEFEEVRSQTYSSYEQACEAAIKYCIKNLI